MCLKRIDFTEINYIYNHGNRIPNIHDVNFLNCKRKLYVSASICKNNNVQDCILSFRY